MRKMNSIKMTNKNPMHDPSVAERQAVKMRQQFAEGHRISPFADKIIKQRAEAGMRKFWASNRSDELRKRFRTRMQEQNPMYDEKVVQKCHKSRNSSLESGSFSFPKGKDHWLWKGRRSFNLLVRSRLYRIWIRPVMKRDGFRCTLCGRSKCVLHVHHLVPLRQIIEEVLTELNIVDIEVLKEENIYSEIADLVVTRHKQEFGTTLCKKCHAVVDLQYRGKE